MTLLLIALGILFQVAPQNDEGFRGEIRDLGSDQLKIREEAFVALKSLPYAFPYAWTDEVRKLAAIETDIENRERLKEVTRCVLGKHAEALFREGRKSLC